MHLPIKAILLASSPAVTSYLPVHYSLLLVTVLLLLGLASAHWLLKRQEQRTIKHYEGRVKVLEESFRSTEETLRTDLAKAAGWNAQIRSLRSELALLSKEQVEWRKLHPKYHRLTFNIGIIGCRGTGKSGLCLRLTDPLFNDLSATATSARGIEYNHSVITLVNKHTEMRTEHSFRFIEWGGEYIIEAQNDLLRLCDPVKPTDADGAMARVGVQALILVVDLATPPPEGIQGTGARGLSAVDHKRIREQIDRHFDARSLTFIINSTLKTHLQTVVVFINKADVLPGNPAEQEEAAKNLYQELLVNVGNIYPKYHVVVGSVCSDAGLLKLYSHLVERILPEDVKKQRPLGRAQDPDVRGGDGSLPSGRDLPSLPAMAPAVGTAAPEYGSDFAASAGPALH